MFSSRFVASILLAVTCASSAVAAPWAPGSPSHGTLRVRDVSANLKLTSFHPTSSYETFGSGTDHPLSKRADATLEDSAIAFLTSHLGRSATSFAVRATRRGPMANHVYLQQTHEGVPFANSVGNVNFCAKTGKVVAVGSSFVKTPAVMPASTPSVKLQDAIAAAAKALGGAYNDHPPTVEYLARGDGAVSLTHVVQIRDAARGQWFEAFVDAHSCELVSVTDFVNKATYQIVPITAQSPDNGGFKTVKDPEDKSASPKGWITANATAGNNAVAYIGDESKTAKQSSPGVFAYTVDPKKAPTISANKNAAIVNAFAAVNQVHDIAYKYGFNEKAYNFQNDNFGKGGAGGDRVTISVQDSAGTDNADFATPPDGQSGHMRMFLWDTKNPMADGALENDIVVHEATHGITNRMTGGGTGRCLQSTEASGLGEGWSDAMAMWTEQTSATVGDFVMGTYVYGEGIRSHPYSTNAKTNPLRYSSAKGLEEEHNIGEIWANTLLNVYAALVKARGFSAAARTDPSGAQGNVVFLHLFLDALAIQPCDPTFTTARDAWIQADANRYAGANKCTLWKAFASRGLGVKAKGFVDDSSVPKGC